MNRTITLLLIAIGCVSAGCATKNDERAAEVSAALSAAGQAAPAVAQTGRACGPDAIPHACPAGYECDFTGGIDVGHCVKAPRACVSGEGQPCGGNTTHACTCASGLVCTGTSNLPVGDVGGTCQKKPECTKPSDCPHTLVCELCKDGRGPACASSDCVQGQCVGVSPCSGAACSSDADCPHPALCALCTQGHGPSCATSRCLNGFCEDIGACSLSL